MTVLACSRVYNGYRAGLLWEEGGASSLHRGRWPASYYGRWPASYRGRWPASYRGRWPASYRGRWPASRWPLACFILWPLACFISRPLARFTVAAGLLPMMAAGPLRVTWPALGCVAAVVGLLGEDDEGRCPAQVCCGGCRGLTAKTRDSGPNAGRVLTAARGGIDYEYLQRHSPAPLWVGGGTVESVVPVFVGGVTGGGRARWVSCWSHCRCSSVNGALSRSRSTPSVWEVSAMLPTTDVGDSTLCWSPTVTMLQALLRMRARDMARYPSGVS